MQGAGWGLVLGLGLAGIWWSFWPRATRVGPRRGARRLERLQDQIVLAGVRGLGARTLLVLSVTAGLIVLLLLYAVTRVWTVSLCFGVMASWLPLAVVASRARRRRSKLRGVWPDAVDHVQSAVRAGLALPEALVHPRTGVRRSCARPSRSSRTTTEPPVASRRAWTASRSGWPIPSPTGSSRRCASPVTWAALTWAAC